MYVERTVGNLVTDVSEFIGERMKTHDYTVIGMLQLSHYMMFNAKMEHMRLAADQSLTDEQRTRYKKYVNVIDQAMDLIDEIS